MNIFMISGLKSERVIISVLVIAEVLYCILIWLRLLIWVLYCILIWLRLLIWVLYMNMAHPDVVPSMR